MLEAAARVGVVELDTAPVYGEAENEIRHAGCTLPIHTKIDHTTGPATSLARSLERDGRPRVARAVQVASFGNSVASPVGLQRSSSWVAVASFRRSLSVA